MPKSLRKPRAHLPEKARVITVLSLLIDLDIGMNDWLCKPLQWDRLL